MRWIYPLIVMLALSPGARGGLLPDGGVTAPEVAGALKDAGYPADVATDQGGDPMIRSSTGKTLFNVYFYRCGNALRCASIQFTAPYRRKGVTQATLAAWNRERRFGRAFQDSDGTAWISMDVETRRGVTSEALEANVNRWITVLHAFEVFIAE